MAKLIFNMAQPSQLCLKPYTATQQATEKFYNNTNLETITVCLLVIKEFSIVLIVRFSGTRNNFQNFTSYKKVVWLYSNPNKKLPQSSLNIKVSFFYQPSGSVYKTLCIYF